jgi:hypothetical protein
MLLSRVLDLDDGAALRCVGTPSECGAACTEHTCPLQTNRLFMMGSLVTTLLEEIRWVRCWAAELESQGIVPSGAAERTGIRVHLEQLHEKLEQLEGHEETVRGVQVLEERLVSRIAMIRKEMQTLRAQLGDAQ